MKKKFLLITGTSGFIGKLFLEDALKKGYQVVDILRDKNKKNYDLKKIKKLYPKSYKSIFYRKTNTLETKLKGIKFECFINFATLYNNSHLNIEIPRFIESNITFPSLILDTIFKKTKKIINFGTMMQHIDGKNFTPINFYASTKSAFEMILKYFILQNKKLKFYNLKFYESFHEKDHRNKLFPILYKNFKKNRTTQLVSKKLELNIIHVNDIIKAIHNILTRNIPSGEYCLKNFKNIKIQNFIDDVNRRSKRKIKVKFLNKKIPKIQRSYFKKLPKWIPDITLRKKIINKFCNENN